MEKEQKRNGEYDFIRGLLIFGVTLGHILSAFLYSADASPWLYVFIRSYDMPMFAMLSGMFLHVSLSRRKWETVLLNKATMILIPAAVWELIFGIIKRDIRLGTSCWFLYALFISSSVILVVTGIIKNKKLQVIVLVFVTMAIHCIPDTVHSSFLLIPAIVGYYLSDLRNIGMVKRLGKGTICSLVLAVWVILLCFWKSAYSVWSVDGFLIGKDLQGIICVVLRTAVGVVGSLAMMIIMKFLYRSVHIWKKMFNWMEKMGIISMEQYILQCFFVSYIGGMIVRKIVDSIGYNPFVFNVPLLVFVIGPAITVVVLFVQSKMIFWIKKIPLAGKYAFGFKVKT